MRREPVLFIVSGAPDFVRASYRLDVAPGDAEARAEALHLEQTVELPREAVSDPLVEREVLARVENLEREPDGSFVARVAYPVATSGFEPGQLLNLLFGNSSLQPDVELVRVELPPPLEDALGGPRFGTDGLYKAVGAEGRALTCTALKPMGLRPEALADLARQFARAGIDVIKDDHGLADHPFCPFEARVRACQHAIDEVARASGRRSLYAPNLQGSPGALLSQLETAKACGVRAVLLAPMLVGLPTFHELVRQHLQVPVLAHPALAGAQRIAPVALLGTLFRACGADAVIYPHHGGRFSYSESVCRALAEDLRAPSTLRTALPVPAGGMSVERVPELLRFYGRETMLLIGGSLYRAGPRLEERSREFVDAVARASEAA